MRSGAFVYLVGAAAILTSSVASAQTNPAAEALFDRGREAMAKGDLERACQAFRESNRLESAVGTQFNLANCEEKRGKLATAWTLFRAVQQKVSEGDERASIAKERIRALEARIPKVTLRLAAGAPRDTVVRDGDVELGAGSFGIALPMDPGAHDLTVSAPGRAPRKVHVELAEGDNRDVEVSPGEASSGAPGTTAPESATTSTSATGSKTRTLGFVIGGVGVAGLGVGAVAGIMVLGKKSTADEDCPNKQCASPASLDAIGSARTLQTISNVGWIVGVLGVGFGAYFVLTSDGIRPTTTVGATPIPAGGQLAFNRVW